MSSVALHFTIFRKSLSPRICLTPSRAEVQLAAAAGALEPVFLKGRVLLHPCPTGEVRGAEPQGFKRRAQAGSGALRAFRPSLGRPRPLRRRWGQRPQDLKGLCGHFYINTR